MTCVLPRKENTNLKYLKMIGWIALAATIAATVIVCLQVDDWNRDWSQNEATLEGTTVNGTPSEVVDSLKNWSDANLSWKVESSEAQAGEAKIHLTHTTGFLRFVDDVHVEIIATNSDPPKSSVSAKSKSRVGKGDLGQNPRNLKKLEAALVPLGAR